MKRTVFKVLTISLIASFAVFFAACPEEPEKETVLEGWNSPWSDPESDVTINSQVGDDGKVTVTVGGTAETEDDRGKASVSYEYTAQRREAYTYKFEAWTDSGSRTLGIQYFVGSNPNTSLQTTQAITETKETYTIIGRPVLPPFESGPALLKFLCADQTGTFYVRVISIEYTPPEGLQAENRWLKEVHSDSTATLDMSVDEDGVCTMTVGGTAETNNSTGWNRWYTRGEYNYTAKANASYVFEFEIWTEEEEGNNYSYGRTLTVEDSSGYKEIVITSTPTTWAYVGGNITKAGLHQFQFYCADRLGTFHVKFISITETTGSGDNFSYTTTEDAQGITIIGYGPGSGGDITIPSEINGKTVVAIGERAFHGAFYNEKLTGVIIPESVTDIGNWAFDQNPLVSITIGADVTVANYAFPGNFSSVYNGTEESGKLAGTYTYTQTGTMEYDGETYLVYSWIKQE